MDTPSTIAVAGLTTALLGTLTVPLIQAHFTNKREMASRIDERRHAAYVDAITYAQVLESRLENLVEDPLYRSDRRLTDLPDELLIRAKLVLVAPTGVTQAFSELTSAWEILSWNLNESGPVDVVGNEAIFYAKRTDKDVVRVVEALKQFTSSIRPKELGKLPAIESS